MFSYRLGIVLVVLVSPLFATAATPWLAVDAGGGERVELDRASIQPTGGGVSARSRVRLGREVADAAGNYDSIAAETLYDCQGRRFTTLRRIFLRGDVQVRDEAVSRRKAVAALPGSLDERLLAVACARQSAAAKPANEQIDPAPGERPHAQHADLRRLEDGDVAKAFPVADSSGSTGGEKPKLIQLPAIDKAALDRAAAAAQTASKAAQDETAKGTAAKAPRPIPRQVSTPRPEAKDAEATAEKRLRELAYAHSGPARKIKKKATADEAENPAEHLHKHWGYDGETGPANWAKLQPGYATCASGKRQSPIDIRDGIRVNLENIRFDYKPSQVRIVDNGHTVQVNLGDGSALHVLGKRYALQQFHFHRPAEEKVNGRGYDMSVHLVHRNDEGQLAVVAVLLEKGAENPLIQAVLNNLPLEQNSDVMPDESIDPSRLLPENRAYWTYMGSLTTPPCTEGVLWMVFKQPLPVSSDQAAIFGRVFGNNARPVQAHNGRLIKETR